MPRPHFRLRTLLIIVAILAVALGRWRQETVSQRRVVEAVRRAGGWVVYEDEVGPDGRLDADSITQRLDDDLKRGLVDDADPGVQPTNSDSATKSGIVAWLRRSLGDDSFRTVVRIDAPWTIRDADLRGLGWLVALKDLDLSGTQVGDDTLAEIRGLRRLKTLGLGETQITDAGLAHLRSLASLETLDIDMGRPAILPISGTTDDETDVRRGIGDTGLAHLAGLKRLENLTISGNIRVTDAGMAQLARLPRLKWLNLSHTKITDAGLSHLKGLERLESLLLWRVEGVTDSGVKHLCELKSLRLIDLTDTQVTQEGVDELKRALPSAHVER